MQAGDWDCQWASRFTPRHLFCFSLKLWKGIEEAAEETLGAAHLWHSVEAAHGAVFASLTKRL